MSKTTIAVLTQAHDSTADHLVSLIAKRGISVSRFDTSEFPFRLTLEAHCASEMGWSGQIHNVQDTLCLQEIKSIWYRRPTHYSLNEQLPDPYRHFADGEASKGFGGILRSLDCLWISHPDMLRAASYKPVQLQCARTLGWKIPRTLITNDPAAFLQFYETCQGKVICKTLNNGFIAVGGDAYHAIYTSVVPPELLHYAENIRHTAHLFQELIPKKIELRVTVMGTTVFAVAIFSQASERTRIDWRKYYPDLRYGIYALPETITQQCLALVRHFHLVYGTIDLILTPGGEYVFLELNPGGQYLWLEQQTGLPMTDTLIDLLIAGKDVEVYG
jgi:glutathione synthase/RimK-type ligase-like ATP-grasp enzyme